MSTETKNKLVPRLRFPEFQNAGEWEVKRVGDVAEVYQPKTISQTDLKDKGYLVYGANGVIGYYDQYNHETSQIAIACRGSSCGTVNFTEPKSWITGNAMVVNTDGFVDIDKKFLFYQLFASSFTYLITGSGQPQITGNVKKHKVALPSLPEQEKIASCLSSLDELITAESQKLELLKQHKKGLLQNLFPQEGETVPKLRFKEFENSGEWEVKRVGDIFDLTDGFPFSSSDFSDYDANSKQVIRITDINNKNKNEDKVYISIRRVKELKIEKYVVSKGDLLLSLTGAAGFNFFIWNYEEGYINQRTMKLSPKNIENKALIILLEPLIHKKINAIGTGQNNNLSKEALKDILFPFPKPNEQQKIASCLSSLDDLITAQTQKIEQLQQHKKGLLQGLFPNMNEQHG